MNKKILVVGGAGYVGSILVPKLKNLGYDVTVVDLLWFGNNLPDDVTVIKIDAFDITLDMIKNYESVVFMAGLSSDPMAEYSPQLNYIYNAAAPAYVAYIAKQAGIKRFVYASSCSVYGFTKDKALDETAKVAPAYPYGISKLLGEQAILALEDDNFKPIALRKGTVYGWSPRMRYDLVVNAMFRSAMMNRIITVDDPNIWRPLLHINDAADAYIKALEADHSISGIFNIVNQNYKIGDLGKEIFEIFSEFSDSIKLNINKSNDIRNYKVDNHNAIKILKFDPQMNVKKSIYNLYAQKNKFDDENCFNIKIFKKVVKEHPWKF